MEVRDGAVVLKPALVIPEEDAWAYTPKHRALLERAHRDSREGRVRQLSEEDLLRIAEEADRAADAETEAGTATGG